MSYVAGMRMGWLSAAIVGLVSCGQGTADAPTSQYTIEGTVLDDLSGHGVAGAKVSFTSDTLDHAETASDGKGQFSFDVTVREGVLFGTLGAEHSGYDSARAHTVYFDGSTHVISLRMRPTAHSH